MLPNPISSFFDLDLSLGDYITFDDLITLPGFDVGNLRFTIFGDEEQAASWAHNAGISGFSYLVKFEDPDGDYWAVYVQSNSN